MEWLKENKAGILLHYLNIMFLFVVADVCYEIKEFNYLYITLLYFGLMVIYWIYNGLLQRRLLKVIFLFAAIIFAAILAYYNKEKIVEFVNVDIVTNIEGINNHLLNNEATYFYQFKPIITVVLPVIVFILLFFYNNNISQGVLVLTSAVMIFFWYLEYFNEIKMLILPFIIISTITYMINNYKKVLLELQKKGIYSSINGTRITFNIIIFALVAAILALPLPQDIKGKNDISLMELLEKKYSDAQGETGEVAAKAAIFGLQYTGYNDTEKMLGGPIELDTGIAFRVESDKAYYLKGDVKDEYTGVSWKKTNDKLTELDDRLNPSIERVKDSENGNMFFPDETLKEMKIYPEKLKSTSFMVPIYTNRIKEFQGGLFINEESSTFATTSSIDKSYIVEYYDIEYKNDFVDYYTIYYGHNDKYSKYLQLPDGITERTIDLVYDLVKDCRNNDEKVKKLRDYLSEKYSYTLNASVLPAGRDFVDYFLFEDQKGYCVYFATALTVMYRIAGIPARYVEGYKMNETSKSGKLYTVTNETAHAWVEYLVSDDIWDISDCSPTALENNIRLEEERKEQESSTNPLPSTNPNSPNNTDELEELEEDEESSGKVKATDTLFDGRLLYIQLAAVASVIIMLYFMMAIRKRRKMLRSESILPLYNYITKRLKRYKLKKSSEETEKEFAAHSDEELQKILIPLTDKVYDEFYGGIKDEKIEKRKIYYDFEKYLKKKENKFLYYLRRLF
jgi:hypothetical protein